MKRQVNKRQTLSRLLGELGKTKKLLWLAIFLSFTTTTSGLLGPLVLSLITENIENSVINGAAIDLDYVRNVALILLGMYIFGTIIAYFNRFSLGIINARLNFKLRQQMSAKLNKLPLKYIDGNTNGEILSKVTNDIDTISTNMEQILFLSITTTFSLVGVVIMMFLVNVMMTLIVLLVFPLFAMVGIFIARKSKNYYKIRQEKYGEINSLIEEMLSGHRIIKAFGYETESIERFEEINEQLRKTAFKAQYISGMIMPFMTFINNIAYILISIVGIIFVSGRFNGVTLTISQIIIFVQYSRRFGNPIIEFSSIYGLIQSTIAAAGRIFEMLDEPDEKSDPVKPALIDFSKVRGEVIFKGVSFGYNENRLTIDNLNINVAAGQMIAIVGPTGAGKTTLVNLLLRFYELNKGHIFIDGVASESMTRHSLRKMFGMVLQDTWLFNGTIKENIKYGNEEASDLEMLEAAKAAYVDNFVQNLPDKYDTVINEEGTNISIGQKQLITIARALLANPKILILDEATSSVDTRTEKQIQSAMNKLRVGRTSFVIAHRLSTIRNANNILVMSDGKVIEQGNHDELLDMNGFYASLYYSQFNSNNS